MASTKWLSLCAFHPEREYLVLLTFLPSKHWRRLPTFFRYVLAIRRQSRATSGMMGYCLLAHFLSRELWTLSVWQDPEALAAFVRTRPYLEAMSSPRGHLGAANLIQWQERGSVLPPGCGRRRWSGFKITQSRELERPSEL
jgi:hypothetical protein